MAFWDEVCIDHAMKDYYIMHTAFWINNSLCH